MSWMKRAVRSRGFWTGNGFVLLVILIVLLGVHFQWPATLVLLAVIALLVVAVAVMAVRMLRADRAATGIEASIRQQAERDLHSAGPVQRAEVERLQERLEKSIEQLKGSKLAGEGMFRSGKRALYALPWYVFIGPPGTGKTTAIVNSGLKFPAGTERLRGVGGTRNCDWFLSDRAILLDTAGRYTTEEQDRDEWFAFLDILKKHRRERPINGVLVGMSLPELLTATPDEVDWHAETIRKRIDELSERLGIRFPVYVVFTKSDLVQGFVETFGEMNRQERDQVWGATFEPGEAVSDAVSDVFSREYDRLHESLLRLRNDRLQRAMKREDRHRVYTFPLEFAAGRERLARFVEALFQANPFHDEPLFRGFYFTSGTQEGIPIDRVIQAIAERFDLPPSYGALPEATQETKSYFLTDVFNRVVVPDRGMARRSGRAVKRERWAMTGLGLASLALLALFVLGASQALVRSRVEVNRVETTAVQAAAVTWGTGQSVPAQLADLDALRREVERIEGGRPVLMLGLDRRGTLREPAREVYLGRARGFVEAYAVDPIRQSLRTGGDRPAGAFELAAAFGDSADADYTRTLRRQRVYDDLKAYLLLGDELPRLRAEPSQQEFLKAHLGALAQRSVVGADTTGRGQVAALVARQTDAYVDALARGTAEPFPSEAPLVVRGREVIFEPPSIAGLYNRIRQDALFTLDPLTLGEIIPGQYLALFEPGPQVPGAFTQVGWQAAIRPAFERESADPGRDDWVMGRTGAELPANLRDPALVRQALEDRYFQEYAMAWERFLREVRYRPAGDMGSAGRHLASLGDARDSPLLWLLAVVTEQTTFEVPVAEGGGLADAAAGVADRVTERLRRRADAASRGALGTTGQGSHFSGGRTGAGGAGNPVQRAFAGLHALNAPEAPAGGAAPELYAALQALASLSGVLDGLSADPAQAVDYAASVLAANGGPLAQALQAVETGARALDPDVRRTLFVQPVLVAWGDVLSAAQGHLNSRWREEVYGPYRASLEGRYPLDPQSTQDAPLGDFETFFAPAGGTLVTFVEGALAPFLASDGRSVRTWQGRGIGLSSTTQNALAQGRRIGEGLFTGRQMRVEFEMQADVPTREGEAPPPDQVYVRVHGTQDSYRMGSYRPWVTFAWPGTPGATVGVSTRQGDLSPRQYDGDWAVFRLLQDAEVRRAGPTQLTARWVFRQPGQYALTVRYDLRSRSATGPFADPGGFFRFTCPPSLG
jgi:type VI secretion system protein ImpL